MSERSTATTLPPSAARRSATARPMPWAAPVTMATLSAKRPGKIAAGVAMGACAVMAQLASLRGWAAAPDTANFSVWKLAGVTPCAASQPRTASTIGGGPQR